MWRPSRIGRAARRVALAAAVLLATTGGAAATGGDGKPMAVPSRVDAAPETCLLKADRAASLPGIVATLDDPGFERRIEIRADRGARLDGRLAERLAERASEIAERSSRLAVEVAIEQLEIADPSEHGLDRELERLGAHLARELDRVRHGGKSGSLVRPDSFASVLATVLVAATVGPAKALSALARATGTLVAALV